MSTPSNPFSGQITSQKELRILDILKTPESSTVRPPKLRKPSKRPPKKITSTEYTESLSEFLEPELITPNIGHNNTPMPTQHIIQLNNSQNTTAPQSPSYNFQVDDVTKEYLQTLRSYLLML